MNRNILKNSFLGFLTIGFVIALYACSGSKKLVKEKESIPTTKPDAIDYNKLYQQSFVYNTFNCSKLKLNLKTSSQNQNVTSNLKLKKGEKIWASVIAFGVAEVARAQITPDKVEAVERLSKSSYEMSFEEGIAMLNAPITFSMLENLIVGNPILQELKIESHTIEDQNVILMMSKDGYNQTLIYDLKTQTLIKQLLSSETKKFYITAEYSAYVVLEGQRFSSQRTIDLDDQSSGKKTNITMDFTNPQLDKPVDFIFTIPTSYKAKKL
ncbi:MAG TPA: DUF4292 domain-containing protein [Edaphocola sp.]|nr:DUF4292 domain-containing protein [Edaphocola sp.]